MMGKLIELENLLLFFYIQPV